MVLLTGEQFDAAYNQIVSDAAKSDGACSVMIVCANDCDAMASCKILTSMLRADSVSYKVKPALGYAHVREAGDEIRGISKSGDGREEEEEVEEGSGVRSCVLLNCGGAVDARALLGLGDRHDCRVYIIDSHRPLHLKNVHGNMKQVVVFGDDANSVGDDIPSDGSDLSGEEDSDEEELRGGESDDDELDAEEGEARRGAGGGGGGGEDEDDEEEAEFEDQDDKENARPPDANAGRGEAAAADEDELQSLLGSDDDAAGRQGGAPAAAAGGGGGGGSPRKRKRRRLHRGRGGGAEARRERRRRIRQYYNGAYHGAPAAYLAYRCARRARRGDTNAALWLAVVGLADLRAHQRIDELYNYYVDEFKADVLAKNNAEQQTVEHDGIEVPTLEDGKIVVQRDYELMLYRHWNLYDSLYFSPGPAARLASWRAQGRRALEELLARMGFALHQCRQKYAHMDPALRARLRQALGEHGPDYGLGELTYESFARSTGYGGRVGAADTAHAVTGLLLRRAGGGGGGGGRDGEGGEEEEDGGAWLQQFNAAYDALPEGRHQGGGGGGAAGERERAALLRRGVDLAIGLQKAVVDQAVSMMDKGEIVRLKHFRYAYIHSSTADARGNPFAQPLALGRLAQFLVEAHRANGKWAGARARPLVVLAERRSTYLAVGVPCPERAGDVLKNKFGMAFRLAAESIQARIKHDGFESSVMEVDRDNVQRFIESLHYTMG